MRHRAYTVASIATTVGLLLAMPTQAQDVNVAPTPWPNAVTLGQLSLFPMRSIGATRLQSSIDSAMQNEQQFRPNPQTQCNMFLRAVMQAVLATSNDANDGNTDPAFAPLIDGDGRANTIARALANDPLHWRAITDDLLNKYGNGLGLSAVGPSVPAVSREQAAYNLAVSGVPVILAWDSQTAESGHVALIAPQPMVQAGPSYNYEYVPVLAQAGPDKQINGCPATNGVDSARPLNCALSFSKLASAQFYYLVQ